MSLSLVAIVAPSLAAVLGVADLRGAIVGAVVAKPDGAVLFAQNPDVRLMPASNQKLFTVAFALDTLGSNYRSETKFWVDSNRIDIESNGTLDLTYARLKALADRLGRRSKVVLWQSFAPGRPESWQRGDTPNRYAPAITALSVERGGVEFWSDGFGSYEFRPAPLGLSFDSSGNLSRASGSFPIARGMSYEPTSGTVFDLELAGAGVPRPAGRIDTLSQPYPDLAASELFLRPDASNASPEDLGEGIITLPLDPRMKRKRVADAVFVTDPLRAVAPRCLQPSDNFLAEQLLMMAARRRIAYRAPVNYVTAPLKIRAWANSRVGLPDRSFDPADGSGLSRKNLVTARSVVRLLNWSRKQSWGATFAGAMAVPDAGTLKGRLHGVRFRGKTGTLDGACSLSGLVKCRSGRELAVSLLMNHYSCSAARVRAIQDEFVKRVAASN